jgi:ethanolamine permease
MSSSRGADYRANSGHLLSLLLVTALTGVYGSWNASLSHGLGYELISNGVLGLAMLIYNCCTSELSSTFPFPGGTYGLARCTLGFYPGYVVGCCEIFYYVMSFCFNNVAIVYILTQFYPVLDDYALLILLLLIFSEIGICGYSRRVLWTSIAVLATFIVVLNFSYIFGSLGVVDFNRYAYSATSGGQLSLFVGSGFNVLKNIPTLLCTFVGTEYVNLTCDDVEKPRRQIPYAQVLGIIIMVIHNTAVALVSSSLAPGVEDASDLELPLNPGALTKCELTLVLYCCCVT